MKQVIILKSFDDYEIGEIVSINDKLANRLISFGYARLSKNRDFLVKPKYSDIKVESRAFKTSPLIK